MSTLPSRNELPEGFTYPHAFLRTIEIGLTGLEPWWILLGTPLREKWDGLRARYPDRGLIPLARRQDSDEVACWDLDQGGISVIRDFAPVGDEQLARFDDFRAWLHRAVDDLVDFGR